MLVFVEVAALSRARVRRDRGQWVRRSRRHTHVLLLLGRTASVIGGGDGESHGR